MYKKDRPMKNLILTASFALMVAAAFAQVNGSTDLSWSTIDSGGGHSSSGTFQLYGVIGQPEAGPTLLTGGTFTLIGGFVTPNVSSTGVSAWALY